MHFDLTDLELFLNVIEAGSITGGAERSHLALASASARVRLMEERLSVALLERGRRGVTPTPAGRALAHHARQVHEQIGRLRGDLASYATGLKGHVRLMANTAAVSEFLPRPLSAFLAANPHVNVDLDERMSFDILRGVSEGLADIGILAATAGTGELEAFPFRLDTLVLVTARDHPLGSARKLAFAETLASDFVGLAAGSALQDFLAEQAAHAGRRLSLRVRLQSFDAICRLVEAGVGIAVVSGSAARRCQRSMAIRRVALSDPWAIRRLEIVTRRFDALPAFAQDLVRHLQRPEA